MWRAHELSLAAKYGRHLRSELENLDWLCRQQHQELCELNRAKQRQQPNISKVNLSNATNQTHLVANNKVHSTTHKGIGDTNSMTSFSFFCKQQPEFTQQNRESELAFNTTIAPNNLNSKEHQSTPNFIFNNNTLPTLNNQTNETKTCYANSNPNAPPTSKYSNNEKIPSTASLSSNNPKHTFDIIPTIDIQNYETKTSRFQN